MPKRPAHPLTEFAWIDSLSAAFRAVSHPDVLVSIGDDAAVLRARGRLVWTIDDSVEGVHFERRWLSLEQAAARAFQAAASDLAAMGARPVAALSSVQLPGHATRRDLGAIRAGQRRASRSLGCPIVGGNVTRGDCFRFSTTCIGQARHPVLRSGARPGHAVWLNGPVGLAGCGLAWLLRGRLPRAPRERRAVERCIRAWREPRARIGEGAKLDGQKHAAIDVSDGLAADCRALALASGVGIVLDEAALRATLDPALLLAARALAREPLEFALAGGEDYALLVAGSERSRPASSPSIGRVVEGRGAVLQGAAQSRPLVGGHDHLAPGDR